MRPGLPKDAAPIDELVRPAVALMGQREEISTADLVKKYDDFDRYKTLKQIWSTRIQGATPDETYRNLHNFVASVLIHDHRYIPVQRGPVLDPLILMASKTALCGQTAALVVDLATAGGLEARRVLMAHHTIAEVKIDGAWHYVDANVYVRNQIAVVNGKVPSVAALARDPDALDRIASRLEMNWRGRINKGSPPYGSNAFFAPGKQGIYYERKIDPFPAPRRGHVKFGWRGKNLVKEPATDVVIPHIVPRYEPGAVAWRSVEQRPGETVLSWQPAQDRDGDVVGYRVYVSPKSRGWNFPVFASDKSVRPYWSPTALPNDEIVYLEPPGEITTVTDTTVRIAHEVPVFVTVIPFDAHGERLGRRIYAMSEELALPVPGGSKGSP